MFEKHYLWHHRGLYRAQWPAYSVGCVCIYSAKGKYLWLPQHCIVLLAVINPPFSPLPRWHIPAVARWRAVPGAALQERLLTPKHRCEYNSSTSHLCFLKTRPPVASVSLTVWIAHCTADYWFCFSRALLLRPSHVLSFPLSKQLTSC